MLYDVYNYSNQLIGQVEAYDATEAWSKAGKGYDEVLDVRTIKKNPDSMSNPDNTIEVTYDTFDTEREVKASPGFLDFITSYINNLGTKYSSTPKYVDFLSNMEVIALHVWGRIQVYSRASELWNKNRATTERLLKHVLAHEYGHYLMTVKHEKIPIPKGTRWIKARKDWVENYAKELAESETGITEREASEILEGLIRSYD